MDSLQDFAHQAYWVSSKQRHSMQPNQSGPKKRQIWYNSRYSKSNYFPIIAFISMAWIWQEKPIPFKNKNSAIQTVHIAKRLL